MTLILSINGPESIWLLSDRRLSYRGRSAKDDGCKVMFLETSDGVAILGYAGLGATARGTQPADWMSAVLRRRNLPLEQSLGVISSAMKQQFPDHMLKMPGAGGPVHSIVIPAFVGSEARLYSIDMAFSPDRKSVCYRYTRYVKELAKPRPPRLAFAGSGARYLAKNKRWMRNLLRIVRANDRGQVSYRAVADHLANLNNEVHLHDSTVGPRCIVAWRHRKGGGGARHRFYNGATREDSHSIPTIVNGADFHAIAQIMKPFFDKHHAETIEAIRRGEELVGGIENSAGEIDAALARLPENPDDNLR